ncbi:AbrB/MazE/SpoVT family DNA-binding domain-containing protein [Desulfoglaeba alkanexedens]|uniref:AbrB/MazE/SpoVT family DNA-binding domain-containing protein n=1 Tax=Desulfoglaeba alkanexedens ALDC TaxID=980445 RepID=A0A4P8L5Z0_9BACT|nr:AbrB/MazE/SpoVT family DNA-binding domain-containing protein [Desulfoglaeba alkanexedens]QCQ22192.1 AbrB/MazE/SpoVT family DNA-binding domain-containing protein [Desulfoglaeba alkanexedens ALDC]
MQVEYKNIDPKLVVNEIRNGRSLEAVQKLFGIKFKSEVQDLYLRGLMELGEIPQVGFSRENGLHAKETPQVEVESARVEPEVVHGQARRPAPSQRPVVRRRGRPVPQEPSVVIKTPNLRTIGQSGSITLNKSLLIDQLGFSAGDAFEIYREDDRVVLKKISTSAV